MLSRKIRERPLPFQGMKSEFEATRKCSRTPICECDLSTDTKTQFASRMQSHALNDKDCSHSIKKAYFEEDVSNNSQR